VEASRAYHRAWSYRTGKSKVPSCIRCGVVIPGARTHGLCGECRHGTVSGYQGSDLFPPCRCVPCTRANAERMYERMHRLNPGRRYIWRKEYET
jgi:hypothetical protein